MKNQIFVGLVFCISVAGCSQSNLRGNISKSLDGKTYLIVSDNNGGQCGPILVDGKAWKFNIGEKGPISSGDHKI